MNVNPGQLCYWVIIPGKPWGSTREKKTRKKKNEGEGGGGGCVDPSGVGKKGVWRSGALARIHARPDQFC